MGDGRTPRYLLAQADWGVDASLAGASFSRANASLAVRYDAMVGVDGCERREETWRGDEGW